VLLPPTPYPNYRHTTYKPIQHPSFLPTPSLTATPRKVCLWSEQQHKMQNSSAVPHHSSPLTQRTLQLKLLRSLDMENGKWAKRNTFVHSLKTQPVCSRPFPFPQFHFRCSHLVTARDAYPIIHPPYCQYPSPIKTTSWTNLPSNQSLCFLAPPWRT